MVEETYEDLKVLISHVDLDGYGSIILGLLTSKFDVIFSCTRQAFTDIFKLQLSKAKVIYICDLCPPESWFDMKNLYVYDHHPNILVWFRTSKVRSQELFVQRQPLF